MANTYSKTKKTRGAANAVTPAQRMRRTDNNKAPVNTKEGNLNKDNAVSQKLGSLMESMIALSGKMQVLCGCMDTAEEREKDAEMPPVSHHPTCTARRRASPWGFPDPDQEVAEEVCKRVAKRMMELPVLPSTPGGEDLSTDDEDKPAPRCRRKMLKSSMDRTGATIILRKITWPHEVVYTSADKPASYQDMSVPQFVHGSPSLG